MSDIPDNQPDRLEGMLRQWGADEAARSAQPPKMARPGESPDGDGAGKHLPLRAMLRWAPLAAAAMLLAASIVVVYLGASAVPQSPATMPTTAAAEMGRFQTEARDLRLKLAAAEARIAKLTPIADEAGELRAFLDNARKAHEAEVRKLTDASAALRRELEPKVVKLNEARLRIAAMEKSLGDLKLAASEAKTANARVVDLRRRLAAATTELTRRRRSEEAAQAKLLDAKGESVRLAARHREIVRAFQRTYLASVAPGQSGVEARKTAVRTRRMLDRLAELAGNVRSEETRRLLDRLEVVLTRLDLIDAGRAGNAESLSRLVGAGELERRIDAALASPIQAEEVQNWLFEAKLILMGGRDAG